MIHYRDGSKMAYRASMDTILWTESGLEWLEAPILQSTVVTIMPQRGLILVPGMSKDGVYLGPVAIEHIFLNSVYDVFTSVPRNQKESRTW